MHYVIISTGEYSDYSPKYYAGHREITQVELDAKARELGDAALADTEYSYQAEARWQRDMKAWLNTQGFERLPDHIPEVNIEYGDLPHSSPGSHDA